MPVVEKTVGGRVYVRRAGREFVPGDRAEVDADTAAYLCEERGGFERVDSEYDDSDGDESGTASDTTDGGGDSDTFDVDGFLDRTPVGDVADDIRAGEADDHLKEIAAAADRVTVQDAVGERRAELEA